MDKREALEKIKELEYFISELDNKTKAERLIEKYGSYVYGASWYVTHAEADGSFIKIALPTTNNKWVFAAYDYCRKIIKENPSDGIHIKFSSELDNSKYLFLKVESM